MYSAMLKSVTLLGTFSRSSNVSKTLAAALGVTTSFAVAMVVLNVMDALKLKYSQRDHVSERLIILADDKH